MGLAVPVIAPSSLFCRVHAHVFLGVPANQHVLLYTYLNQELDIKVLEDEQDIENSHRDIITPETKPTWILKKSNTKHNRPASAIPSQLLHHTVAAAAMITCPHLKSSKSITRTGTQAFSSSTRQQINESSHPTAAVAAAILKSPIETTS